MPAFPPGKLLDFVSNFRPENPNQKDALLDFEKSVRDADSELLTDEAKWVRKFRTPMNKNILLKVPYFSQRDNYRDAYRTCFSSSCAMLLEAMKPGTLPGSRGDDKYVREVFKSGDTTDAHIQIQTLKAFGLPAKFVTNGTFSLLDSQLSKGIPVPIGILHKGPASRPSGGGHWLIVIGKELDPKAPGGCWYIVHDPWGEIDHASGTYPKIDGKTKKYSKNLLDSRWTVDGENDGWAIIS